MDKIQMDLDQALAWIKLGIMNKNYSAAKGILDDIITECEKLDDDAAEAAKQKVL